jgi:hypothetical protein
MLPNYLNEEFALVVVDGLINHAIPLLIIDTLLSFPKLFMFAFLYR